MAYVAPPPTPRASRAVQAGARWTRLAERRPDLRPAIDLQRRLLDVGFDLLDAVQNGHVPRLSLPPRYVAAKLGRGVPALSAEPIPVPTAILAPALLRYCDILASGGAGQAATHLGETLRDGRIEPGSLLAASLTRDQAAIRRGAEHLGLAPDLVWLVAELSVGPFAHALQLEVLGAAHEPLSVALDGWRPGFCPACGSWPALAELVDGRRVLRCSFCAAAWTRSVDWCIACHAEPPVWHTESPGPGVSLELCDRCRGYLKVSATTALSPYPLVAVTDLETTDLDVEAMRRQYRRPAMAGADRPERAQGSA